MSNFIEQTSEPLTYFLHDGCGWWSISEAPKKDRWYCPYCGKGLLLVPMITSAKAKTGQTIIRPEFSIAPSEIE